MWFQWNCQGGVHFQFKQRNRFKYDLAQDNPNNPHSKRDVTKNDHVFTNDKASMQLANTIVATVHTYYIM